MEVTSGEFDNYNGWEKQVNGCWAYWYEGYRTWIPYTTDCVNVPISDYISIEKN